MAKDEFQGMQGDVQRPGSGTRIMALARSAVSPLPNVTPKVDFDDRQVVSMFDTRPIDSYDFVLSQQGVPSAPALRASRGLAANQELLTFDLPVGFVSVVRRIEFDIQPPHNVNSVINSLEVQFLRSDSPVQENILQLYGLVETYGWNTHHIFGYWEKPGILFTFHDLVDHSSLVRIFGNLIPAKNASPRLEIGSPPLAVKK